MHEINLDAPLSSPDEEAEWIQETFAPLQDNPAGVYAKLPVAGRRGLVFWVVRDSSTREGFRLCPQPGEQPLSSGARGFAATAARPEGYPQDLPFLAGTPAVLNPDGASTLRLHWFEVPDGLAALRSAVDQCASAGWVSRRPGDVALETAAPRYVELVHGRRTRVLTLRIHGGRAASLDLLEADT